MERTHSLSVTLLLCLLTASTVEGWHRTCKGRTDAIMVVDGSSDVGSDDFDLVKYYLYDYVDAVINGDQLFGVVVFSDAVGQEIPLSDNERYLKDEIDKLTLPGGGINTHLGIERMIDMMESQGRNGTQKVGVVITAGQSSNASATAAMAQKARDLDFHMVALGYKGHSVTEIAAIASSGEMGFDLFDVYGLFDEIYDIADQICIVDGVWASWNVNEIIGPCSVTCGTGERTVARARTCTYPSPSNGGTTCPGTGTEDSTITCTMPNCPDPNEMCANCEYHNGNGYLPVPNDCFSFYQCKDNGNDYEEIRCPLGTYYNPQNFRCDHCLQDSTVNGVFCDCSLNVDPTVPWDCRNRRAVAGDQTVYEEYRSQGGWTEMSCGPGHIYDDVSCTCDLVSDSSSSTSGPCSGCEEANGSCYKLVDCSTFLLCSHSGEILATLPCPPGLDFNMNLKVCDWPSNVNCNLGTTTPPPQICLPDVYLPFNGNTNDESGNQATVVNENVDVHPLNYAMFYNNSGLQINRFSNMDFQKTLEISFTFKLGTRMYSDQSMVSNADCGDEGSFNIIQRSTTLIQFIVFDSDDNKYDLSINLDSSLESMHSGSAAPSTPITLEIRDGLMTAEVGSNSKNRSFPGSIRQSPCALHIGRASFYNNFMGHMDDFMIYIC